MLTIEEGDGGRITIAGRFDAAQAPAAQAKLDRLGGNLVLDCQRLEYISSAGLGVLLKTQKRLLSQSARLRLIGVGPHIRDIFTYSGFDQIFEIEAAG